MPIWANSRNRSIMIVTMVWAYLFIWIHTQKHNEVNKWMVNIIKRPNKNWQCKQTIILSIVQLLLDTVAFQKNYILYGFRTLVTSLRYIRKELLQKCNKRQIIVTLYNSIYIRLNHCSFIIIWIWGNTYILYWFIYIYIYIYIKIDIFTDFIS